MKFPNNFRQFLPTEAVKQISQFVGNPKIADALKEAAEKAGLKESFSNVNLQPIQQVFENASRWMEDLAQHFFTGLESGNLTPGINGTGELFSSRWSGVPISSQQALFLAGSLPGTVDTAHLTDDLTKNICQRTGAQEVVLTNSTASALFALASAARRTGDNSPWILPRQNCIRVPRFGSANSCSLREVLDTAQASVLEVGTNQDCQESEILSACHDRSCFALSVTPNRKLTDGSSNTRASLLSAKSKGKMRLVELVFDGILFEPGTQPSLGTNVKSLWQEGIDIAIVPTEYLIGTSEGCMILFREHSDLAGAVRPQVQSCGIDSSAITKLLLSASIQSVSSLQEWEQTELGQVLTTSTENLLNRAQRMAKQIEGSELIARAEACVKACPIGAGIWSESKLESGCVRLYPKTGSSKDLATKLSQGGRPIWCNTLVDSIEIVLRSMAPHDDLEVVQRLTEPQRNDDVRTDSKS
ncbi:hypothetical protein SH449x_005354 [Pirellulaceae bacterium SH449]